MGAIDTFIDMICKWLLSVFHFEQVVVVLISILPIVEARGAIPIAIGYGLSPLESWFYAFIGSSIMAAILLVALMPLIKWLSGTKVFKKLGTVLYEKFEKKSQNIKSDGSEDNNLTAKEIKKSELKKMLGIFVFVAIPLPLTGVWTGSAIAAIAKLKYWKSLVAVVLGNMVASLIILLLSVLFGDYVNIITLVIFVIAIVIVIGLIIKVAMPKKTAKLDIDANETKIKEEEINPSETKK